MKALRIVSLIVGSVLLMLFCIPLISRILNLGNIVGIIFGAALVSYGIFSSKINTLIKKLSKRRAGKIFIISSLLVFLILVILIFVISVFMYRVSHNEPKGDVTLVVLGCHVRNGRPSLMLSERLHSALVYLNEHEDTVCILSGGQGADEAISEAQCMYDYLIRNGISKERLIMEDKSTSTIENLEYSYAIIEERGLEHCIAIVTNEFHECRASLVAKKLGLECYSVPAHTHWWFYPTYLVREWFGVMYEYCR